MTVGVSPTVGWFAWLVGGGVRVGSRLEGLDWSGWLGWVVWGSATGTGTGTGIEIEMTFQREKCVTPDADDVDGGVVRRELFGTVQSQSLHAVREYLSMQWTTDCSEKKRRKGRTKQ